MTITERYEKERQMETELRIRKLKIRSVEHLMEYKLDPFGQEFDKAAGKLQKLRAEQHRAGLDMMKYHQETIRLEEEAKRACAEARRQAYVERRLDEIEQEAEEERERLEALVIQAEQEHKEAKKQDQE